MDDKTFAKCTAITEAIYQLREKMNQVTAPKRPALQERITKLQAKRTALLGLDKVSKI